MSNIRLASDILFDSVVDGNGLRMVMFTQGCTHNCSGCHNVKSHDLNGGKLVLLNDVFKEIDNGLYHSGITISGGEPFLQAQQCSDVAVYAKSKNLNVWVYTGFLFEDLLKNDVSFKLLNNIDVLVDGKFDKSLKSLNCKFKGSTNQRIIDVKKSIEFNKIELLEF